METVETMSTTSTTVITCMEQDEELAALSARWPQFDVHELRRLRFLAYRQATGRLHPSAPLGPIGVCVCEEIAAYLRAPTPPAAPMPAATALDVPPLWRAWLAAHGPAQCAPSTRCL